MLNSIKAFFEAQLGGGSGADGRSDADIQLATAALLVEIGRCDSELDERESKVILERLKQTFDLPDETLEELIGLADEQLRSATDLFQFTQLINKHYSYAEKLRLLDSMWKIAYADDHVDKFEDHMIRKVAGLIHLPHSDFIKSKLRSR